MFCKRWRLLMSHSRQKTVVSLSFLTSPGTQITLLIFSNSIFKADHFHLVFRVMACLEIARVPVSLYYG